jgi:hypothetical protein
MGDGVTALWVRERVNSADAAGAYAEYRLAPADLVTSLPDAVTSDRAVQQHCVALLHRVYRLDQRSRARSRCSVRRVDRFHQWLDAACSVYLTTSFRPRLIRTHNEFAC